MTTTAALIRNNITLISIEEDATKTARFPRRCLTDAKITKTDEYIRTMQLLLQAKKDELTIADREKFSDSIVQIKKQLKPHRTAKRSISERFWKPPSEVTKLANKAKFAMKELVAATDSVDLEDILERIRFDKMVRDANGRGTQQPTTKFEDDSDAASSSSPTRASADASYDAAQTPTQSSFSTTSPLLDPSPRAAPTPTKGVFTITFPQSRKRSNSESSIVSDPFKDPEDDGHDIPMTDISSAPRTSKLDRRKPPPPPLIADSRTPTQRLDESVEAQCALTTNDASLKRTTSGPSEWSQEKEKSSFIRSIFRK